MTQKHLILRFGTLSILVLVVALCRLLPHAPNFSPITALCLFSGAYLTRSWQKHAVPLLSIWISDLLINNFVFSAYFPKFTWFYEGFYWQYGTYAVLVILAAFYYRSGVTKLKVGIGALGSALVFYLISNFGVWISGTMYPADWRGLIACYIAGIPFFKYTVASSILYCSVLFGCFSFLEKRYKEYLKPELELF